MGLMDSLRQVGSLAARGNFTLDLDKARDKMARFQLTDPERYVLELAAAAYATGAETLEARVTPEGLELVFEGTPLPPAELECLEDFLLVAEGTHPALRYLAVGLNALSRLHPARVSLETPAGACLTWQGGKRQRTPASVSRHRLLIDRGRSLLRRPRYERELALLKNELRSRHRQLSLQGLPPLPRAGAVQLVEDARDGEICLAVHGVVRQRLRSGPPHCRATLEDDELALNASHSGVLENEALARALKRLERESLEQLSSLCQQAAGDPELLEQRRPLLLSLGALKGSGAWKAALESLPLFQGPGQRRSSFSELEAQRKRVGYVPTTTMKLSFEPGSPIVYPTPAGEQAFLEARGVTLRDAGPSLMAQLTAHTNKARWEQSPRPLELPTDDYAERWSGTLDGVFLAVGLPWRTSSGSLVHVLYQGRLLASQTLDNKHCFTAVLDFQELRVRADWSGPEEDDASYRSARRELESRARQLYEQLARQNDPRAYDQLMLSLMATGTESPAAGLNLLPTLRGRTSLAALTRGEGPVGLLPGVQSEVPAAVPEEALPPFPVIRTTTETDPWLRRLLTQRVVDARPEMERLSKLAARLSTTRPARLETAGFPFGAEGISGELQLRRQREPFRSELTLLRCGIELERRSLQPVAWPCDAIVDSPRLTPTADLQKVVSDRAWQEVVDVMRQAEEDAFLELATRLCAAPEQVADWEEALRAGLDRFPALASRAAGLPLFASRGGSERVSLADLEKESVVSYAESGPTGPGILHRPDLGLLARLLPGVELRLYEPPPVEAAAPPPVAAAPPPPALHGQLVARRRLPFGEVGLTEWLDGGSLLVPGVGEVPGLLPRAARGVMVREGLNFSAEGKLKRDGALVGRLEEIRQTLGEMALECSAEVVPGSARAWMLVQLLSTSLPEEARRQLESMALLPRHCGPPCSVAELRPLLEGMRAVPVIEPGFPFAPLEDRPVLSATTEQTQWISALFGKPCRSDRDELIRDETRRKNRRRAAGLKVRLPACLAEIDHQGELLQGRLGLPVRAREGGLICLEEDRPVGEVRQGGLAGFVRGSFRLGDLLETVELTRAQVRELKAAEVRLLACLAENCQEQPAEPARQRLLAFLAENRRELGSKSPTGQVLEKLLDLHLFPVSDGRLATPRFLLEEAARGPVAYLEKPSWFDGQAGLLPVLRPRSLERDAARALVGERQLRLESRPGLVERGFGWLDSGWNRIWSSLDRVSTDLARRSLEAEKQAPRAESSPHPQESAEEALVRALRRELTLLCPGSRGPWIPLIEGLSATSWWDSHLLGTAVIFRNGRPVLNWAHPAIRSVRDHYREDPGCLSLLAAHLFCELNRERQDITDEHELVFLTRMVRSLKNSYAHSETDS